MCWIDGGQGADMRVTPCQESGESLVREVTNPSWGCEGLGWHHGELGSEVVGTDKSRQGAFYIWEPQAM